MNLRQVQQEIVTQKKTIDRLSVNADALDLTTYAMMPSARAQAKKRAAQARAEVQAAIIRLHELEKMEADLTPPPETLFQMLREPEEFELSVPEERGHLWQFENGRADTFAEAITYTLSTRAA